MDFLGLRTLSIIERARKLIKQSLSGDVIRNTVASETSPDRQGGVSSDPSPLRGRLGGGDEPSDDHSASDHTILNRQSAIDNRQSESPSPNPSPQGRGGRSSIQLDLERLHFNDPRVLELFQRGETGGVFQFESGGHAQSAEWQMKPNRLEDLIAANALYRPGPMELIPALQRSQARPRARVPTVHPIVDRNHRGNVRHHGVPGAGHAHRAPSSATSRCDQAYTLIKAISKKKKSIIDANREQFINGVRRARA